LAGVERLKVRAPRLGSALGSARGGAREAIGATPGEDLAPHIIHTVRAPDLISALSWLSSLRDSVPLPDGLVTQACTARSFSRSRTAKGASPNTRGGSGSCTRTAVAPNIRLAAPAGTAKGPPYGLEGVRIPAQPGPRANHPTARKNTCWVSLQKSRQSALIRLYRLIGMAEARAAHVLPVSAI
jgi:hypothetical protein